ncbi:MAG: DUF6688 family protein [Thermoguttaceae bacterium]
MVNNRVVRAALFFAGVVLPSVCFLLVNLDGPEWQSGRLIDYAGLLLSCPPSLPLWPLLLYCMISMSLVVFRPARFCKSNVVRFGIFSGVLIAAEYAAILEVLCYGEFASISPVLPLVLFVLAAVVPMGILWLDSHVADKYGHAYLSMAIAVIGLFLGVVTRGIGFEVALIVCIWCSTPWAFAAYTYVSARLIWAAQPPRFRFSLAQLFAVTTWFAAHCGAWRASYLLMLHEYSRLPTTPPHHCFVCTAAARGHAWIVGSQTYVASDGTPCRVNDQLRRLKAFELLLASVSPAGHRALRRVYDRVGPPLAALLARPLAADAAYVALKPVEWLARLTLRLVLGGQAELIGKLYRE